MHRLIMGLVGLLFLAAVPQAMAVDVYVSILPQKYLLERIGGDLVDVSVMVMPGASPATYEPTPRQMGRLSRADAYFGIGVPFESAWMDRIASANRNLVIVRVDEGVGKLSMATHHHDEHDGHDAHEEHAERTGEPQEGEILDPHIWLSPKRIAVIAANTCAGLVRIDPENRTVYEANLAAFLREVEALDADIRTRLAPVLQAGRSFMVFHPSWGYFADDYGLKQVPIEVEGKSPGPRELAEIVEHARELGVTVVFVQPQFSRRSAAVIAGEIGAEVVPLDPLAEDWDSNLRRAADAIARALK